MSLSGTDLQPSSSHGPPPEEIIMRASQEQNAPQTSHDQPDSEQPLPPAEHRKHRSRHHRSHDNSSNTDGHKHRSSRLLGLLFDAEQQSADLRRILATTLARSQSETLRVHEAEAREAEALHQVREARAAADTAAVDVKRLREELAECHKHLDRARRDAAHAIAAQRDAVLRRSEAERFVRRAREVVQRMEDESRVRVALSEGRRKGFQQGLIRAQRLGFDDPATRRKGKRRETPPSITYDNDFEDDSIDAIRVNELIGPPDDDLTPTRFLEDTRKFARDVAAVPDFDDAYYRDNISPLVIKSRFVENMSEPPDLSERVQPADAQSPVSQHTVLQPEPEPQVDVNLPPISGTKTPPIQVYAISIPPQDELEKHFSPPQPPVDPTSNSTPAPNAESSVAPAGPRRRTRSGRLVQYLSAANPRRWPSVKSNHSAATTSSNPTAPHEAVAGLGLIHHAGDHDPEERLQEHPAALVPSSSDVREIFGGIIKPFRSLRRKKRDSEQTAPGDELGEPVPWHYSDDREPDHKHTSGKHSVLARLLRRRGSTDSLVPDITIIPPSRSPSATTGGPEVADQQITEHQSPYENHVQYGRPHMTPYSPPTPDTPVLHTPSHPFTYPSPQIAHEGWGPGVIQNSDSLLGRKPAPTPVIGHDRTTPWAWESYGSGSEEGTG